MTRCSGEETTAKGLHRCRTVTAQSTLLVCDDILAKVSSASGEEKLVLVLQSEAEWLPLLHRSSNCSGATAVLAAKFTFRSRKLCVLCNTSLKREGSGGGDEKGKEGDGDICNSVNNKNEEKRCW